MRISNRLAKGNIDKIFQQFFEHKNLWHNQVQQSVFVPLLLGIYSYTTMILARKVCDRVVIINKCAQN